MNEPGVLPNGRLVRYGYRERLMHWLASVTYVYLLLTGLAFWSPWLSWLGVVLGGGTISRILHPWFGVGFFIAVLWMLATWSSQMRTTDLDRAWWRALPHYIRNEDEAMPPEGRFNAGQKMLFWAFLWCGLALLLSGLVLWEPHWIPWDLRFLRFAAVIVHVLAFLVTVALFMVHVYMGTVVERGAFASMTRGDVSRAWAWRHHRAWYDQVTGDSTVEK